MTNQEFISALTARLNVQINLPFLNEAQEAVAIEWCISRIVVFIPDSIRDFILDASDGLSLDELNRIESILVAVIAGKIDIPWVPESLEPGLIRPVVQAVLDLARKGVSLNEPDAA